MALFRPDYKLKKAKDLIDSLDDSENNDLIRYYIKKQEETIKKQNDRIKEYSEFFRMLDSFLPNKNVRIK